MLLGPPEPGLSSARHLCAAGTIVDGAVRDVDEAMQIGYPVFATGTTPRTARGRAEEKSWGQPVEIDGVSVSPGDYVLADSSGVVVLAAVDVGTVIAAAEAIATKEASMAADIEAGEPVSEAMGASYEAMLDDEAGS